MLPLLIGVVVGFFLGVTIMALLAVASRSESEAEWAAAAFLQARPAKKDFR